MPTCDIAIIIVCAGRHGTTERRAGAPGMNTKYEEFIDNYRVRFEEKKLFEKLVKEQKKIAREDRIPSLQKYMLKPNSMQVAFIHNLKSMLESGVNKALLVSATGDGGIIMTSQAKTA